jgi:hypothetical protein
MNLTKSLQDSDQENRGFIVPLDELEGHCCITLEVGREKVTFTRALPLGSNQPIEYSFS